MMRLFLQFELQKILKYFQTKTLAKMITGGLFLAVFIFVGTGLYYFFLSGFRFINFSVETEIQQPLTLFIYELFLLVMAAVVVFSSIVSGIFNLYRGQNDNWLISSPGYKLFPRLVLVKSLLSSSWPLFVMFLPAVLAFNKVHDLNALSLVFILISVVLLLVLLNAISLLGILLVSSLYYAISKKIKSLRFSFGGLITLLLVIVMGIITSLWNVVADIDLVKLFRADDIDVNVSMQNISNHFNFLPTHPLALEIINWQNKMTLDALLNFGLVAIITVVAVALWWKISSLYYPLWQKFQEGSLTVDTASGSTKKSGMTYSFTGGPTMALFKKEALVSSRNLKGVLWSLFLGGLWLAQVGTNVILSNNIQRYQTDVSEKLAIFQALQFIIAIYFICSFALRFVFPSFSVEKKTAWILGSAPLSFTKIFFSKYLFYGAVFVVVGSVMSYINVSILDLAFTYGLYSMTLFIATVIFIVTLALSLGAVFPSTETDDPEAISTSMSGLFFTALSLIFGALSAWILYATLLSGQAYSLFLFVSLTIALSAIMLIQVPLIIRKKTF